MPEDPILADAMVRPGPSAGCQETKVSSRHGPGRTRGHAYSTTSSINQVDSAGRIDADSEVQEPSAVEVGERKTIASAGVPILRRPEGPIPITKQNRDVL